MLCFEKLLMHIWLCKKLQKLISMMRASSSPSGRRLLCPLDETQFPRFLVPVAFLDPVGVALDLDVLRLVDLCHALTHAQCTLHQFRGARALAAGGIGILTTDTLRHVCI